MGMFKSLWKARKVFKMPKLYVKFGKWVNDPCLPVWRNGNTIFLARYKNRQYFYNKMMCGCYKTEDGRYAPLKHKVNRHYYWKQPIRRKLKKLHLSWIPPEIQLPIWLSFRIFNLDVIFKYKWNTIRFEYPPQFTIVFFGLSLSFWFQWPTSDYCYQDHYWESLLNYVYEVKDKENFDIVKFRKSLGHWQNLNTKTIYWQLQYDYLKPKYQNILYAYDNRT